MPNIDRANVMITGGLGFIGSNLAHDLVEAGAHVLLVDSLNPLYGGNLFNVDTIKDRVRINISDVRDETSMRYLIQGQDIVFNLAGQTSHMDSMEDPFTDMEINCRAQLSILEAARKYNPTVKVVYASTRQIYGKPDSLPVSESHLLRPVDVNGINKMAGEWYHILYNNTYGIKATALRLTNTYGPRMRIKDARQTFLGIWTKLLVEGKPFEVWGGSQLRDFTYVDDCADALILAATSDDCNGLAINLGGPSVLSLVDTAQLLVDANGAGSYVVREFPQERKRIDIGDYYADFSLATQLLGWMPKTTEPTGFTETLKFYRSHIEKYL